MDLPFVSSNMENPHAIAVGNPMKKTKVLLGKTCTIAMENPPIL
jgi:hypothetical protein